jgi:exonuclease 3'-5' domain-containing protein 1
MDGITHITVSSAASLTSLLTTVESHPATATTPSLFLDLEGISLSRHGSISIVILYFRPTATVYLVDVHTLGATTFTTPSPTGTTLKSILESPTIAKVFFDVRNDSDALFSHYGVRLGGIEDVQLMENAARPSGQRRYVNGLERCIRDYAPISMVEKTAWKDAKEKGVRLFAPEKGGSYEVFNVRPLKEDMVRYCANDVRYLPVLRDMFWARLGETWRAKVRDETAKRVRESQSPHYQPNGESKKFGPWGVSWNY